MCCMAIPSAATGAGPTFPPRSNPAPFPTPAPTLHPSLPPPQPCAALDGLTSISLSGVPTMSDETLRMVGQRHPAVATLSLALCAAVTAGGLGQQGAFPALRCLALDGCDSVSG